MQSGQRHPILYIFNWSLRERLSPFLRHTQLAKPPLLWRSSRWRSCQCATEGRSESEWAQRDRQEDVGAEADEVMTSSGVPYRLSGSSITSGLGVTRVRQQLEFVSA